MKATAPIVTPTIAPVAKLLLAFGGEGAGGGGGGTVMLYTCGTSFVVRLAATVEGRRRRNHLVLQEGRCISPQNLLYRLETMLIQGAGSTCHT